MEDAGMRRHEEERGGIRMIAEDCTGEGDARRRWRERERLG